MATAQVSTEVRAAGPPSRNGPLAAVPTGVISAPDAGSTPRTVQLSATSNCPLPNETPQGELAVPAIGVDTPRFTLVPAAGPPTPPATVEIVPSGAARCAARSPPETAALVPAPASTVMATPKGGRCQDRRTGWPGNPHASMPFKAHGLTPQVVRSGASYAAGSVHVPRLSDARARSPDDSFAAGTDRLPRFRVNQRWLYQLLPGFRGFT
jgi:hypothetical protein